jgi:hypothetical protein
VPLPPVPVLPPVPLPLPPVPVVEIVMQTPFEQFLPEPHTVPQLPQLLLSADVLTQLVPHSF